MGTTLTLAKAIWIWPQLTSTWSTLFSHVLLRRLSERFFRLIVFSVRPPLVLLKKSSPTRCTWRCRSLSTSWWLPGRWCSRWPGWSSPTHRYRPHVFREPGRSSMYSWIITIIMIQFFSVALVHFSDQNFNSPNHLFNLHIIVSLVHIKKAVSHFFEQVANALVHPFKWLCTIRNVMLIKMYCNGSLLKTPQQHLAISSLHKSL